MPIAPLLALAAAALSADAPRTQGAEVASAQVTVEIVRPAIVRQGTGLQDSGPDLPKAQVTRRGGTLLVEFQ